MSEHWKSNFTHNIKGPSRTLSSSGYYRLQPLMKAMEVMESIYHHGIYTVLVALWFCQQVQYSGHRSLFTNTETTQNNDLWPVFCTCRDFVTLLFNLYILGHVLLQSSTEYYSHMVLYWTLRFIFKYVLFLFSKIITTCSLVSGYENWHSGQNPKPEPGYVQDWMLMRFKFLMINITKCPRW